MSPQQNINKDKIPLKGFKVLLMNIKGSGLTSSRLTSAFYQLRVWPWTVKQHKVRFSLPILHEIEQHIKMSPGSSRIPWGSHAPSTADQQDLLEVLLFSTDTPPYLHFQMMYQLTEPGNRKHDSHQNTLLGIDAKYFSEQTGLVEWMYNFFTQQPSSNSTLNT